MNMLQPLVLTLLCLLVMTSEPASLEGPSFVNDDARVTREERAQIVDVWQRYARCLQSRSFESCFGLLSKLALGIWEKQHDVKTGGQYAKVKRAEEVEFSRLTIVRMEKQGLNISVHVDAFGSGEGGRFQRKMKFIFVVEDHKWRLDNIIERGTDYLP